MAHAETPIEAEALGAAAELAEPAQRVAGDPAPANTVALRRSFSEQLWDIRWEEVFPATDDGWGVGSLDEGLRFASENLQELLSIDPNDHRWHAETGPEKLRFHRMASDVFLFRDAGVTKGIVLANPTDWSTYYLRLYAMLPSAVGGGVGAGTFAFLRGLGKALAGRGVRECNADLSPANRWSQTILSRLGYRPVGNHLSERWGALTIYSRLLQPEAEDRFLSQFCAGPAYRNCH